MRRRIALFFGALVLLAAAAITATSVAAAKDFQLESTIAFTSTRDAPPSTPNPLLTGFAEIYLMNPDGTNPRRLTNNTASDAFPTLSPEGKKIVFNSNRRTAGTVCGGVTYNNIDDLFLMETDGSEQTPLTRGTSASWSPDSKNIAFHASASYYATGGLESGCPIRTDPGSATSDSDIFVANVDDLLAGVEQPTNITNSPGMIDDDADWSPYRPDGQKLVFTSHPVGDATRDSSHAELYLMDPDGTDPQPLTNNDYEERAPAWSPDGSQVVYSCRVGPTNQQGIKSFRICVINADGTGFVQLTDEPDSISDLTASWSPDGQQILFHRQVPGAQPTQQLFVMNADGSPQPDDSPYTQLTFPPGFNNLAHWGVLRVMDPNATP